MAVTISKDTCGKTSQEYVRDVLRQNLTDVQSPVRGGSDWIFKSHEEETVVKGKLPRVYIEQGSDSRTSLTPELISPPTISINIDVWDSEESAEDNRDQIADQIIQILSDSSSTDGTKTFREQNLAYISSSQSNEDSIISDVIIRMKRLSFEFLYYGP